LPAASACFAGIIYPKPQLGGHSYRRSSNLALTAMNTNLKPWGARLAVLFLLGVLGCRNCPIESCHVRKQHLHGGQKYRGQPLWKKQNPAIGEKIKTYNPKSKKRDSDKSKSL
jgi:hypothetical protein